MKDFFVEQIMSGFLITALPVAFVAGVISFLSPCVLPLVPGYLSFAAGFSLNRGKVFLGSILFVLGFSTVFVSYGAIFGGLGNQLVAHEDVISKVLGALTIFLGFVFLGKFPFAPTFRPRMKTTGGLIGAPILGFLFGVGWTPCIGPTLGAVLNLAFDSGSVLRGAFLAIVYSLGLGLPFVLVAAGFGWASKTVGFVKKNIRAINLFGGALLVVLGLLLVTGLWQQVIDWIAEVTLVFTPAI